MMRIYLGNAAVHQSVRRDDGELEISPREDLNGNPTIIDAPDDVSLVSLVNDVTKLWSYHSSENPLWVAAENDSLAELLAGHYDCDVLTFDEGEAEYRAALGAEETQ